MDLTQLGATRLAREALRRGLLPHTMTNGASMSPFGLSTGCVTGCVTNLAFQHYEICTSLDSWSLRIAHYRITIPCRRTRNTFGLPGWRKGDLRLDISTARPCFLPTVHLVHNRHGNVCSRLFPLGWGRREGFGGR